MPARYFLSGQNRGPDLRERIRLTLKRRSHREPSRQTVEDIYQLVIHFAADERFERLERIIEERVQRDYAAEKKG